MQTLDTPETLSAWEKFEKDGNIVEFLKHTIKMERERNELLSDKSRLDWLETQDCWIGLRGSYSPLSPIHSAGGCYDLKVRSVCDGFIPQNAQIELH